MKAGEKAKVFGVGLVGFGVAGSIFHAPLLSQAGFVLRAVMTRQKQVLKERYPEAEAVGTVGELLDRNDVDVVVIAAPNELHSPIAEAVREVLQALEAGKHVVVDKPFCVTLEEANKLVSTASSLKQVLAVFHNRRWDCDFLMLQREIQNGTVGEILSFESSFDRFRSSGLRGWKGEPGPGAGALYDLGPHLIDQALVLFGLPDWVSADLFIHVPGGKVHDGFCIRMGWGERRATLSASTIAAYNKRRFLVHGTNGSIRKLGRDPQEEALRDGEDPTAEFFGEESAENNAVFTDGETGETRTLSSPYGCYLAFYKQLHEAIETNGRPPVTAEEGRNVMLIIDAVEESHRSGKRIDVRKRA